MERLVKDLNKERIGKVIDSKEDQVTIQFETHPTILQVPVQEIGSPDKPHCNCLEWIK